MKQVVIENPVINSLSLDPERHFQFTDEGMTNEVLDGRRTSSYFVAVHQKLRLPVCATLPRLLGGEIDFGRDILKWHSNLQY